MSESRNGTLDYQGTRDDKLTSISGDLVNELSREIQLKAEVRRDIPDSSEVGSSSAQGLPLLRSTTLRRDAELHA